MGLLNSFLHGLAAGGLFSHKITHIFFFVFFRHARVSSTSPCMSVRPSVRHSCEFPVSLIALREKLKREDPNYFFFSILGLDKISQNWSGKGGVGLGVFNPKKLF